MHYFKKILIILILLILSRPVLAYYFKWERIPIGSPEENYEEKLKYMDWDKSRDFIKRNFIELDIESINEHNDSLYYAIKYYDVKNKVQNVAIIQSKGNKAGVVETYGDLTYEGIAKGNIYKPYPPRTSKTAKTFEELTPASKIYNANIMAMAITGYNGDIDIGYTDFTDYINKSKKKLNELLQAEIERCDINISAIKNPVTVKFKIAKIGKITDFKVIKPSGSIGLDKSIELIIRAAVELYHILEFPQFYDGFGLDMEFTYDYNNPKLNSLIICQNVEQQRQSEYKNTYIGSSNVNVDKYMKDLQKCIKKNWHPKKQTGTKKVVAYFEIAKDGTLLNSKIIKTSGDESVDNEALSALKNTTFKPLPKEFKENSVPIEFTFEVKSWGLWEQ